MFTYRKLLGRRLRPLKDLGGSVAPAKGPPVKKAIYVITLVLLGGALIVQSVWGADAQRVEVLNAAASSAQAR